MSGRATAPEWRALAEALPAIHERENLGECRNANTLADGGEEPVKVRQFGEGMTVSCCPGWPQAEAFNLISRWPAGAWDALDEALAWIDAEGGGAHVRVSGREVDVEACAPLAERGFALAEVEAWLWAAPDAIAPARGDCEVGEVRAPEELALWAATGCEGWKVEPSRRAMWSAALAPNPPPETWRYVLARSNGEPAGTSLLTMEEEGGRRIGYLADASVAPAHRGRGLQRDLIAARTQIAREAGAELVFAGARWGTASQRNMERSGLKVAEATALWRRAPRR